MRFSMTAMKAHAVETEASLLREVYAAERAVWDAQHALAFHRATDSLVTWNQCLADLRTAERAYAAAQDRLKGYMKGKESQ